MISFVRGTLAFKGDGYIVVETGGIGYQISIASNSSIYMVSDGKDVKVHTKMIVKEDDISLYGFDEAESLKLFNQLTSVSGVGAKGAMAIIGSLPPVELKLAIANEDANILTRANGIGKKTAQRIVIDLHDKMDLPISDNEVSGLKGESGEKPNASNLPNARAKIRSEAAEALCQLGLSKNEAALIIEKINLAEDAKVEDYIKQALKMM